MIKVNSVTLYPFGAGDCTTMKLFMVGKCSVLSYAIRPNFWGSHHSTFAVAGLDLC